MATTVSLKPPVGFWIVAAILLLWNLAGCFACYMQLTASPETLATLTPAQQEAWTTMPGYATGAYVLATLAGLAGAILLLLRKKTARLLFGLSLLGVIIQFGWFFGPFQGLAKVGPAALPFPLFIAAMCLVEIWFTGFAAKRDWVR